MRGVRESILNHVGHHLPHKVNVPKHPLIREDRSTQVITSVLGTRPVDINQARQQLAQIRPGEPGTWITPFNLGDAQQRIER